MKLVVSLIIAIVLTGLSIMMELTKGRGYPEDPKDIAFPFETKLVEVSSSSTISIGNLAVATGEGKFIITGSNTPTVQEGTSWKAYGVGGGVTWGDRIKVHWVGPVEIHCKIEIPQIELKEPVTIRGYISIQGIYPIGSSSQRGVFQNIQDQIDSREFSLFLYPIAQRQAVNSYFFFRFLFRLLVVFAVLAWIYTAWRVLPASFRKKLNGIK